jgi:hypothetical protein
MIAFDCDEQEEPDTLAVAPKLHEVTGAQG